MPVLSRPAAPTHELPGASFTALAGPSRGSLDTSVWEVRLSAGHPATPHELTHQEVFVVTAGEGRATIASVEQPVGAGDVVVVPARTTFALSATGDCDLVALCCFPVEGRAVLPGGEPFTPPWAL